MDVTILGYLLVMVSAALFAAPLVPIPRVRGRSLRASGSVKSKQVETMEFIMMLTDQLRIGSSPLQALVRSAAKHPMLALEIDPRTSHDQVLFALRRSAVAGAQALLKVALFVDLSNQRGTPLVPALDAIVQGIETELALEEELLSELAGAKATALLMSLLPLLILLALHPFHFLFGTMLGRIALTGSVLLNLLGRLWLARITKNALAVTS